MGKKNKKTRWRTFTLNGHQSDSEESSTPSFSHQNHRNYHNKYYNSKFTYSSQSTPIRKYQNDSSKTTRSNSTTSEHKTTFNEDEYTRITTPRQDVLFKKGYLNKPKSYQTQTSTGTSSTANSTSTCTPDHQSADGTEGTDLEYESQFVFPNGFIDQNGIYYVNSYEPFPFVIYNAPVCYPDYAADRTKRYSTDSVAESVSPHNEEVIQNGAVQSSESYYNNATASDNSNQEPRRLKKKRRRKISRTKEEGDTSCDTDLSDVVFEEAETHQTSSVNNLEGETLQSISNENDNDHESKQSVSDSQTLLLQGLSKSEKDTCHLKPDAEEFVPRTFQAPPEIPYEPPNNIQYVNFAPSYISVPYINHNPTFLPPGIPINYVPIQEPKFVNIIVPGPNETKEIQEDTEKVSEVVVQSEQNSPKKAPIDISKIVLKLEEAVVEQNKRESNIERQHATTPIRKARYQYPKSYRVKPQDKPNVVQVTQTHPVHNRLGNICSKPNNYSATLKKNVAVVANKPCTRYQKTLEPVVIKQRPTNQWISVSSRKKKRKGTNEQQDEFEELEEEQQKTPSEDLFESFDVNLLEDVVPPIKVEKVEECKDVADPTPLLPAPVEVAQVETEKAISKEEEEPSLKHKVQKKKSKQAFQKVSVKRIIITDDLQTESSNEVEKSVEPQVMPEEVEVVNEPEVALKNQTIPEIPEKKKKKKKKVAKLQSISSSTTTLSNLEDSYDFLLENSIMEDSDQKTNIEMSHVFDRMIQKGMYNSLEEKIKALKIGASDDGFFKTINFSTFKASSTPSKQIFAPPQFDTLFQQTVSKNEPELKPAIFLENPTVNEIIKNVVDTNLGESSDVTHNDSKLYPITQAVKNWLTKTRENTPDIELLKSPSTIYKKLGEEAVEKPEDEVTLWSVSPQSSQEEDLLNFWENEPSPCKTEVNGYQNGHIDEGEDAIEIYESKYGKNEDYLKLKAEVAEEQQKTARNFPRHGNLPYRAICCNVM